MTPLLALLLAWPAAAQPVPSARPLDAAGLDRLFDGRSPLPAFVPVPLAPKAAAGAAGTFVIRAEDDPLPAAPRFALNLESLPPEYRHTIPGFERLFHRNQEETKEAVDRVNAVIRARGGKVKEWTYDGRANEPPWVCLSYAAATTNDWWALQLGRSLPSYQSQVNGSTEAGLDPRLLEAEYYRRASLGRPDFVVPPKLIQKDPVRNKGFPFEPRGYARLLVEDEAYSVADPSTGETYSWDPGQSAMEGEWLQVFTNNPLRPRTPDAYARKLAEAIGKWGVAYVQLEHTDHPRWPGAHAVAVVGWFCMEAPQRLIDCAANRTDEDWGRTAYFIAHDSFGGFGADKVRAADGASAYRAVRIGSIDQAIVFPHGLRVSAAPADGQPGVWRLRVTNMGGQPVGVTAVRAEDRSRGSRVVPTFVPGDWLVSGRPGEELSVVVEAPHYYGRDGKGRAFRLKLADGETAGAAR